jgi:hypothetical protein
MSVEEQNIQKPKEPEEPEPVEEEWEENMKERTVEEEKENS